MANQVHARLSGDDYQHLWSWFFVLELLMPRKHVRAVYVEDSSAGSFDDVTVRNKEDVLEPDRFYQIKYHVDQRDEYSTEKLVAFKNGTSSILRKFWNSWKDLRQQTHPRRIELYLLSNWVWSPSDKIKNCISGKDNSIHNKFREESDRSEIGKLRKIWKDHLEACDGDFKEFIKCLRFNLGFDSEQELEERVSERMGNLGLKSDNAALLIVVGIVRNWIKSGIQKITLSNLDLALTANELFQPADELKSVTVHLNTIKHQKFEIEPDYMLDWQGYFESAANLRGHQLKNPANWNSVLLPELQDLESKVSSNLGRRLIRARGMARLSAWFAFGHIFSEVARYVIEIDQYGELWRTDAMPSTDFPIVVSGDSGSPNGETLDGKGNTVAVGISITGSLDDDVQAYLEEKNYEVAALLLLRPEHELGRRCIRNAGDVVALVDGVKNKTRAFVAKRKASRLLVFYFGPLSGACFIGHGLNAVCKEIQIMEDQQPSYAPSFLLR